MAKNCAAARPGAASSGQSTKNGRSSGSGGSSAISCPGSDLVFGTTTLKPHPCDCDKAWSMARTVSKDGVLRLRVTGALPRIASLKETEKLPAFTALPSALG
eukprot:12820850-Alexandrium_andersonii.AAC.1